MLLTHAAQIYAYDYFGVLFALAVLEWVLPRRQPGNIQSTRWAGNVGIAIFDALVLRFLFPAAGFIWAAVCLKRGWGLMNHVTVPTWFGLVTTVAALDLLAYAEHYLFHRVPVLWRIHLTHHTDQDVDFTTGLRFHPLESVVTTGSHLAAITILGLPPTGVLIAELLTGAVTFWEHANLRLPAFGERALRLLIVTPEWHRTHHSTDGLDNQSNFGNVSTCWDRLFGTYRQQPMAGSENLTTGVRGFEDRKHLTVPWILLQPFLTNGEAPADTQPLTASRPDRNR